MSVDLYVKQAGQGAAVVLLHGLFGAGANLGALARDLRDRFAVFSVDLPNHGRSGWLPYPDLPTMADSVLHWMDAQGLTQAHVIGHSLGGKVAMQLALCYPPRVQSLVVADIAPVAYAGQHEAVFAALEAVAAGQCSTREEATVLMTPHVQDAAVIQFLLSSLHSGDGGTLRWRFDLQGIRAAYPALLAAPQAQETYPGPVLFIKGGASDYIQERHWPAIQALFPAASIRVMPDCDHWLHVQRPQLFNGIVARFLRLPEHSKLAVPDSRNEG